MRVKFRDWKCDVDIVQYAKGGTAIQLVDVEDGCPVATATVWVPGLERDEVAVKNYSENEGMLEFLLSVGIVAPPHRSVKSGYVTIPVCRVIRHG